MDVFAVHDQLIADYEAFTSGFTEILDVRIREHVEQRLAAGDQWPNPYLSLNPNFASGGSIPELVSNGLIHPECEPIFRVGKDTSGAAGKPLDLHQHQREAIEIARGGASYVLTTGTGSGKSLSYIVPIVDSVLRQRDEGRYRPGVKAIIVYPMNALANSQRNELEKFLKHGFAEGQELVKFERYTGQDRESDRAEILDNPPDILLTNYVMLELVLTRPDERKRLITAAEDLRSAKGYRVGMARVGDVQLWIKPKLPINRLLFLLGYAADRKGWRDEEVDLVTAKELVPAVAQMLWRLVERAIGPGLLQGYCEVEETSLVLRGRLREPDQLRRHHGRVIPMELRHDEFTVDIPENQILLAAITRMLAVERLEPISRRRLNALRLRLADAVTLIRSGPLPAWQPHRLNARYHSALRLAEIVWEATSPESAPGFLTGTGFIFNMNKVFEDFVTEAFTDAFAGLGPGGARRKFPWPFDETGTATVEPDLVWTMGGVPAAVVDAKYKSYTPTADLYQMLAYCTVLGLRRGYLISAAGDASRHVVRGSGVEIVCQALDLTEEPTPLLARIDTLARELTGH